MGKALLGIAFSFLFVSLLAPAVAFAKPINIGKLPYVITMPGQYTLSKSIVMTTSNDGITINADNVTLDMAGNGITAFATAPANVGINIGDHTGVKVMNGFITGFANNGIKAGNTQNLSVTNMDIFSNNGDGIYLSSTNSSCTKITDCTVHNNVAGIGINGFANRVSGCTVNNNTGFGIFISNGYVSGNVACHNGSGISGGAGIKAGDNCLVEGNVCYGNFPDFDINAGATKGLNYPVTP